MLALIQHPKLSSKNWAFSIYFIRTKDAEILAVLHIGCKMGAMASTIMSMFKEGRRGKKEEGSRPLPIPFHLEMRGFPRSPSPTLSADICLYPTARQVTYAPFLSGSLGKQVLSTPPGSVLGGCNRQGIGNGFGIANQQCLP